jgi:hypothetical protein
VYGLWVSRLLIRYFPSPEWLLADGYPVIDELF